MRPETDHILLGAAPGIVDRHIIWAVGAHLCWHAGQLARAWKTGTFIDSDSYGGTFNDGHRCRKLHGGRRQVVLSDRHGEILTVRLADAVALVDRKHLPSQLVDQVRDVLAERTAASLLQMAASQAYMLGEHYETSAEQAARQAAWRSIERRCEGLAALAWEHVRPADALFDLDLAPAGGAR